MKSPLQKILLVAALFAPLPLFAETGAAQQSSSFNPVLFGLLSIIVVLMASIGFLAYVYQQLALAYRDKLRKERTSGNVVVKTVALLLAAGLVSVQSFAQEAAANAADGAAEAVAQVSPYISGIPRMDFYALVTIIGFQLLAVFVFLGMIYRMVQVLRGVPERVKETSRVFKLSIWDRFNNAVAVEKEADIMLDHDYDGIKELDNSLPPWWKWGFAFTILFSGVYLYYYHMSDGPLQVDEYNIAVAKAEAEQAAYLAKAGNAIDENTVKLITEGSELADAGTLFKNTCAACHREDGGGSVGPNLADDYWLHGGSLPDVFKSIKYGWKDKGMPEWKTNMSAKQIAGLASYIKSMKGKKVEGGKAPQGDLYVENAAGGADSSAAKTEPKLTAVDKATTPKG